MVNFEYDFILIRYGELTTKGKNRQNFVNQLTQNIKMKLRDFSALTYEKTYDRFYIKLNGTNEKAVISKLEQVFGISSFSLAVKTTSELAMIVKHAVLLMEKQTGQTFKVLTRRKDKNFPASSDQINRACASEILKQTTFKVDVHDPEIRLQIEVGTHETYLMADQYAGAGGFPLGSSGRALLLLSGGIDSPVAGYLTMKKGVRLEAIHFASPPYTSEAALDKVLTLARKLSGYQGQLKLHIVPFTNLQLAINQAAHPSYQITIMRRMMIRIATIIAERQKCLALVSGESIGQVASQTLESMATINAVTNYLILRPIISWDKIEIIDLARKIETYETSILPYEDCCTIFTPVNPVIKPLEAKALSYEARFDYETLIAEAIANTKTDIIELIGSGQLDLF